MYSGAVYEKSYLGSVTDIDLNASYAAVLFDGKIHLHRVSTAILEMTANAYELSSCSYIHLHFSLQIDPVDAYVSICFLLLCEWVMS